MRACHIKFPRFLQAWAAVLAATFALAGCTDGERSSDGSDVLEDPGPTLPIDADADADAAPLDGAGDDVGDDTSHDGSGEPLPTDCPTPNPAFVPGCEPLVPACTPGLRTVPAEAFRGRFGTISPDGLCQNDWPAPWLATCTEPLAPGVPDLRGLWADEGHVERIEQCGDLVIIVGDNYTHGGYATGVPEDGVNDVRADDTCETPIQVALRFEGQSLQFVRNDQIVVTRTLERAADGADELVWRFGPGLAELARMRRYCALADVPPTASSGLPGTR